MADASWSPRSGSTPNNTEQYSLTQPEMLLSACPYAHTLLAHATALPMQNTVPGLTTDTLSSR